jgi:SAM-dependent methyltransferase
VSEAAVSWQGYAPTVMIGPATSAAVVDPASSPSDNPELQKYLKLWNMADYRAHSPGEYWSATFLQQSAASRDAEVIDFGCGTGRGGLMLALIGGMKVKLLDFAPNCLDEEVADACKTQGDRISFEVADLTKPIDSAAVYGYCCDVMEHIPPADVKKVLRNILSSAQHVFFAISCVRDAFGPTIGEDLHLTIQPMSWWLKQLTDLDAVIHWSEDRGLDCAIYCSAWKSTKDDGIFVDGQVNTPDEVIEAQVRANILAGWAQLAPAYRQDREVIILAGGPSLPKYTEQIKQMRADGCALVTVNGSYNWAIEQGLQPSAQIIVDAREFNSRFASPVVDGCKYLIASQCHPSTLSGLPTDRTILWHSGISQANADLALEQAGYFYPVPGSSTVMLRALPLLRMLGLWKFHVFGWDSCILQGEHHGYPQPENDGEHIITVTCGGRAFKVSPWMLDQAIQWQKVMGMLGDEVDLAVYGNGLLAQMIETGAALSQEN